MKSPAVFASHVTPVLAFFENAAVTHSAIGTTILCREGRGQRFLQIISHMFHATFSSNFRTHDVAGWGSH